MSNMASSRTTVMGDDAGISRTPLARALTFSERLDLCLATERLKAVGPISDELQQRLDWWERELKRPTANFLKWRSEEHSISEADVLCVLAAPEHELLQDAGTVPDWLTSLEEILADVPPCPPSVRGSLGCIAWPWMHTFDRRLSGLLSEHADVVDVLPVHNSVSTQIFVRLTETVQRTAALELKVAALREQLPGSSAEDEVVRFSLLADSAAFRRRFYEEYPVLARLLTETVQLDFAVIAEMIGRMKADRGNIAFTFSPNKDLGRLVRIDLGLGDRHCDGRTVMRLEFQAGLRLIYKPRDLNTDAFLDDLFRRIRKIDSTFALRIPTTLHRNDYAWVEEVLHQSCKGESELNAFHARCGQLLAVLYFLRGSDAHFENLMACGEYPILLDTECLFSIPPIANELLYNPEILIGETLLGSGLLPGRPLGDHDGAELSGLSQLAAALTPYPVPVWERTPSGELQFGRKRVRMQPSHNSPFPEDCRMSSVDFVEAIVAGWETTAGSLKKLWEQDSARWEDAFDLRCRYVPVSTFYYLTMLRESHHPNVLRDALDRDALLDQLWAVTRHSSIRGRLIRAARLDLWRGDVPFFRHMPRTGAVVDSRGVEIVEGAQDPTVPPQVRVCVDSALSKHNWVIRQSLACSCAKRDQASHLRSLFGRCPTTGAPTQNECIAIARAIGDYIRDLTYDTGRDIFLLDVTEVVDRNRKLHFLGLSGIDLYNGLAGVQMFFHYLADLTAEPAIAEFSKAAHSTIARVAEDRRIYPAGGGYAGAGSVLYGLSHGPVSSFDPTLLFDTLADAVHSDEQFDVIGGCAGIVCSSLAFYAATRNNDALELAIKAGQQLLDRAEGGEGQIFWKTSLNPVPMSGFAHGTSGIAYSLMLLAAYTGDKRFFDAFEKAQAYERTVFDPTLSNWRDTREWAQSEDSVTWCYGAPGIGLFRIAQLQMGFADYLTVQEIEIAFKKTLSAPSDASILCHGALGNWELLDTAARTFNSDQWSTEADKVLSSTLDCLSADGPAFDGPAETLNLMLGLSGIGYALLRKAAPSAVPSVLLLQPPPRALVQPRFTKKGFLQ